MSIMIIGDGGFLPSYQEIVNHQPENVVWVRVDPYREKHKLLVENYNIEKEINDPEYLQLGRAKKKGGRKRW